MTAPSIKHKFVSTIPDGAADGRVRPSNWNDEHDITGLALAGYHDEPLTDGLGGFVFDGTDIVVVVGVPN